MYGLTVVVGVRGAPWAGVLDGISASTVSMSPATAWPVHALPVWSRIGTPARWSRLDGRTCRRGR